jgi:hypothetical protein
MYGYDDFLVRYRRSKERAERELASASYITSDCLYLWKNFTVERLMKPFRYNTSTVRFRILASTEPNDKNDQTLSLGNFNPETLKKVPLTDLALYACWPYVSDYFLKMVKKGAGKNVHDLSGCSGTPQ